MWALSLQNVETLTDVSWRIRQAVNAQGFPEVDHVELFGPPASGGHSRNFVLCPGKAYDRSPAGRAPAPNWPAWPRMENWKRVRPGSRKGFWAAPSGEYRWEERAQGRVLPVVTGTAHVIAEATLILSDEDPFQWGIRPA